MRTFVVPLLAILLFLVPAAAQVPTNIGIRILKAEDARDAEPLADLLASANAAVRSRAALAAGRIGDEQAVAVLKELLDRDPSDEVRTMAAFALGEIESINAADAILKTLGNPKTTNAVRARAVEAAGKIAAANARDGKAKALGAAILDALTDEQFLAESRDPGRSKSVVLAALTAVLRARPEGGEIIVARFLIRGDARIRADAANTLTRLRAKNANAVLRAMLVGDTDARARANAARALGAADDKDAFDLLLKAATTDQDSRVRVAAIRALGNLKDVRAVTPLEDYQAATIKQVIQRDGKILTTEKYYARPPELSEWLEITTALGNILAGGRDTEPGTAGGTLYESAPPRLMQLIMNAPETSIARAKIDPELLMLGMLDRYSSAPSPIFKDWRSASSLAQGFGIVATLPKDKYPEYLAKYQTEAQQILRLFMADKGLSPLAMPDVLTAYAAFKPNDLGEVLRRYLQHTDVQIRATSAGLIAGQPLSKEIVEALKTAFTKALLADKNENDAQLAILDALYKLDKRESVGILLVALSATDYLVRKKAFELLADKDLQKDFLGIPTSLENARLKHKDHVLPYAPAFGTKLGQVLNTDADYRRALARKNGTVKAVLKTDKGMFTIDFVPEDAPLTVDNFIKLARTGYFNGVEVHRVVPNFVMQDGDRRGDGNGGPGWSIRCEVNMLGYDRGAVGMALSGKDTGGSQWFVTHSPQPHLDGGYTVFGHVNETDMRVVDNIVRGDRIISVKIVEGSLPQRTQRSRGKK